MAPDPVVLVVDDEAAILRVVNLELSALGFRVVTATDADAARAAITEQRPDIILLDIVMPGTNGLELLRTVREQSSIPVILLTARDRESDKVRGLETGADDYIVKPFGADELAARIRAVLRRAGDPQAPRVVRADGVDIDLGRRTVTGRTGEQIPLTRNEWQLLETLASNAGKVLLSGELLARVWGPEYRSDLQYLRVWVSRLRHKLEADPSNPTIIRTRPGIGYFLAST